MYDPLILWLVKLLLSQYWSSLRALMAVSSSANIHPLFFPAGSDQEEGEQGAGRAGREDGQGQHLEAGDCREREPAEYGAGTGLLL